MIISISVIYFVSAANLNSCTVDSDCKVKFSNCGCANVCVLKGLDSNIDCARACAIEESDRTITNCKCENNKCVGKQEASNLDCKSLYWFDNSNKECGQKQFCGMYMYYGLQTFETKGECESALNNSSKDAVCIQDSDCQSAASFLCGDPTGPNYQFCREKNTIKNFKCVDGKCKVIDNYSYTLSNGRNVELKIMPETASARAVERLGQLNFTVELKEFGSDKIAYELEAEKEGKILGLFKVKGKVSTQVNAETGEVIKVKKPWWVFLATGI